MIQYAKGANMSFFTGWKSASMWMTSSFLSFGWRAFEFEIKPFYGICTICDQLFHYWTFTTRLFYNILKFRNICYKIHYFKRKSILDEPSYYIRMTLKLYVIDKIKLLGVESSNVGNMLKFATILSIKIKATRPL